MSDSELSDCFKIKHSWVDYCGLIHQIIDDFLRGGQRELVYRKEKFFEGAGKTEEIYRYSKISDKPIS